MNLSIESLTEMGAFTGAPVEKEITWKQGDDEHTATVYVRRLSYHSATSELSVAKDGMAIAGRIAGSICDKNGKAVFSVADIIGEADPERGPLNSELTMALLKAIGEVNSLGKAKASTSQKKTRSGTSSSSTGSAAGRSRKRSKTSATQSS